MVQSPAQTFAALADPNRLRILDLLSTRPIAAGDLVEPLGISLPGVLKHLRVLEAADLVATRKEGRTRWCELGPATLDDASDWITAHRRKWHARMDRFERYASSTTPKEQQ